MNMTFSASGHRKEIPLLLSHHDLVFRAPVCDPTYGLPLGNGDTGLLLHLSPDTLHVQINHTDLIDRLDRSEAADCTDDIEHNTTLRNGARLDLRFCHPFFETIFTEHFEARLSLADAVARIDSRTPFGAVSIEAFAERTHGVGVITLSLASKDDAPLTAILSRFGSRTLSRWYYLDRNLPSRGTDGTESFADGNVFGVTQALTDLSFAVAARAVDGCDPASMRLGAHQSEWRTASQSTHRVRFYVAVGIGHTPMDAKREALAKLDAAVAVSHEALAAAHTAHWNSFWSRSYVSLPAHLDVPENLWYLNLYYANCQNGGRYPPHFCNGVWGWYYDFVPWLHYFHYNTQLAYFPLHAANHPELTATYFRFRRNQLSRAEAFCRKAKEVDGAFYTDVCDYDGKMDRSVPNNCTCGAQIAMAMYRHYRYTGDEVFLADVARPVMERVADFYLAKLIPDAHGIYHIYKTQTYEGSPRLDDAITDLSMIRALFSALIPHTDAARAERLRDRLSHLVPFTLTELSPEELDAHGAIATGLGRGCVPSTRKVLSTGIAKDGSLARRTLADREKAYYGFPDVELAPVYPASLVGIAERGEELYESILNSVYLHPANEIRETTQGTQDDLCMGWCMLPIYLARLGLSALLEDQLTKTVDSWIRYPQGFGLYTRTDRVLHRDTDRFGRYRVSDVETDEEHDAPAFPFRHFDHETTPILATAINEMLLQSHGETLRLFGAVNPREQYAFCLLAEGGVEVEAAYDCGRARITLAAQRDVSFRLVPEHVVGDPVFLNGNGHAISPARDGDAYLLALAGGERVTVAIGEPVSVAREYAKNTDVKTCGTAKLGCAREYAKKNG